MNILISNDDGIEAAGIRHLAQALGSRGDVYVVAPDKQRSASSHALSVHERLVVEEVADFPHAKRAWKMSGTPADCVKLGLDMLRKKAIDIDIIYTGINHGANLGSDTMYSGTVSAAAEGAFAGYPAVAVSVCAMEPTHFEGACRLALEVFDRALEMKDSGRVISLNAPDLPMEEIRGVRPARLGTVVYDEWFEVLEESTVGEAGGALAKGTAPGAAERIVFQYTGTPVKQETKETDIDMDLVGQGYATVSMIRYDLNDYEGLNKLKEWELTL